MSQEASFLESRRIRWEELQKQKQKQQSKDDGSVVVVSNHKNAVFWSALQTYMKSWYGRLEKIVQEQETTTTAEQALQQLQEELKQVRNMCSINASAVSLVGDKYSSITAPTTSTTNDENVVQRIPLLPKLENHEDWSMADWKRLHDLLTRAQQAIEQRQQQCLSRCTTTTQTITTHIQPKFVFYKYRQAILKQQQQQNDPTNPAAQNTTETKEKDPVQKNLENENQAAGDVRIVTTSTQSSIPTIQNMRAADISIHAANAQQQSSIRIVQHHSSSSSSSSSSGDKYPTTTTVDTSGVWVLRNLHSCHIELYVPQNDINIGWLVGWLGVSYVSLVWFVLKSRVFLLYCSFSFVVSCTALCFF
jgi:hypothetical protein